MFLHHIYNVANIVSKIEKNKGVKNLYEKVNQLFKGAATGSPELIDEIKDIIEAENKRAILYLTDVKSALFPVSKEEKPVEEIKD